MSNTGRDITPEARRAGRLWGGAIIGGLALVVVVNVLVAWLARQAPMDLVRDDYYEAGLAYGEVIEAGRRATAAGLALVQPGGGLVGIEADGRPVAVTTAALTFYRPSDRRLDFGTMADPVSTTNLLTPRRVPANPGRWDLVVRFRWQDTDHILSAPWQP